MEYYVRFDNGEIDGPFSVEGIRDLVATGKLTPQAGVVEARGQRLPALKELLEWATVSQLLDGVGDTIQLKSQPVSGQATSPVVSRYRDAYRIGAALVGLGIAIKVVGAILAGIILLGSLSLGNSLIGGGAVLAGVFVAVLVGVLFWVCGVIVAAQGQILRATLDNTVASSPFLSNHERLDAMGLPHSIADRRTEAA